MALSPSWSACATLAILACVLLAAAPSADAVNLFEPHTDDEQFHVTLWPTKGGVLGVLKPIFSGEKKRDARVTLAPFDYILVDAERVEVAKVEVKNDRKRVVVVDTKDREWEFSSSERSPTVFPQFVAALEKYNEHLELDRCESSLKKLFRSVSSLFDFSFGINEDSMRRSETVTREELSAESMDWSSLFDFSLDLDLVATELEKIEDTLHLKGSIERYVSRVFPKLKFHIHLTTEATGASQDVPFPTRSGLVSTSINGEQTWGTMGGLLARKKGGKYDSSYLGISNEHVWHKRNVGRMVCAPATRYVAGEKKCIKYDCCRDAGTLVASSPSRPLKGVNIPDWSASLLPSPHMAGRKCAVPHIGDVKGMMGRTEAGFGMVVQKFGSKTHYTKGKITAFNINKSNGVETFTLTPDVKSRPKLDPSDERNKEKFPMRLFDGVASHVKKINQILNSKNLNVPKLDFMGHVHLVDEMWKQNLITVMCDKGDSGSFVFDAKNRVVGLLHSFKGIIVTSGGKKKVNGYDVYPVIFNCYAQRINSVVDQVNKELEAHPSAKGPWTVCVESQRK